MRGASSADNADEASAAPRLPGRCRELSRAKLSASLKWLLCKAYDGCIPLDFREPLPALQEDTVSAVHMNLGVRSLLVNSKLYCAACERLFGAAWNTTFNGHWSVIQSLARHGFYVAVDDGTAVSEADLSDVQPFNTNAHLAVINTMMAAHVAETAPVVRVVQAIRSVTSFNASKELPCSSEDALLLWMNKIWALTAEARHKASQLLVLQSAPPTVRLNKNQLAPCELEQAPGLCADNLVETLRDGRCIAATISFYFPRRIKMEDVCLAPTGGVHDATRNWQLICAACSTVDGLATGVHFAAADLYDDRQCRAMKSNILSLVAEVFCACAAVSSTPPAAAAAAVATSQTAVPLAGKPVVIPPSSVLTGSSHTLISEATKRSFMSGQQRSASAAGASAAAAVPVELRLANAAAVGSTTSRSDGSPAAASPSLKQPLLTKRHKELTSTTGQPTKASFCAWEDKNGSDAADRLSSSEPSDASVAQVLTCSSRWGVYPFNSDQRSPIEDAESSTAPPDSARTYTLPSKTLATDAASQAAASVVAGTSLRHMAPSPAMTVASMCDSAAAADQECANILVGGSAVGRSPDSACVAAGEVRASANDAETPVTARSLVSNTMLWCDDDDDVTVSLDSEGVGGGEGFYLHRRVVGDSVASGTGSCGRSLAWSPPLSVEVPSAKDFDNGRAATVPDAARETSEEEPCSSRGVSRTTSFAELKHFISTPVNVQPAATCAGDGTSPHDDIRSPSAASNSSGGTMGSGALLSLKTEFMRAKSTQSGAKSPKKTTFAMKQTTWAENATKQKSAGGLPSALVAATPSDGAGSMEASVSSNSSSGGGNSGGGGSLTSSGIGGDLALASESAFSATARQHADVRLLLAERRRAIEAGRQAAGAARGEQRDEISREAFLQAVLKQQQRSTPQPSFPQPSSSAAAGAIGSDGAPDFQRLVRSHGTAVTSDDVACAKERLSPVRAESGDHATSTISADQQQYHPRCGAETPRQLPGLEHATACGSILSSSTAAAESAADKSSNDSAMAGAMDDYGTSLDKLSSSITELQFELARLALKQKHMEDAAAAAAAVAATAPADGGVTAPAACPASSRHATYALPSQVVVSSLNSLAAVSVNGGLAAADSGVWHSPDTSVPAFTTVPHALLNQAASGIAAAASVCSTAVHRDSKPFRLTNNSISASQAPKASSRHGTVVLSAATAASQTVENSWPISGSSRGGSAPPSANGSTAPISGTGGMPATGSAAVRSGGDGGAFFVPVQATVPSSSQRRSSADAAAAEAAAGKLPTAQVKHQSGKRATWCVTTPGTDRTAIEPWLVAATAPSPVDETMPPDDCSGAMDVAGNIVVRPLGGSCDGSDEDMQRRRERIQQLEQRRLEDVQRRRRAKEVESERRREELRTKEMAAERKKAEERLRRELILQQYKERKAEDDPTRALTSGDGGGRIIAAPVQARPRSSAARRSPANVNRHSSGAILGGQLDSLLLPTARDQAAPSGAVTHRRSISPSMSASDIASLNGKHSKKVSIQHGPAADAVFGNSHGALQAVTGGSAYSQQQRQMLRVSSPDPSAASSAIDGDPGGGAAALKLFVQPSFKSNRGIIINAISHCVLAGTVNTDVKNKVLEELARSDAKHFLILFRDSHLQYRGIYAYNLETEDVAKVSGQGPKVITEKMFERFYKYNSGSKSFSEVTSTKHLSVSIDAITIKDALWQKKPSAMPATTKRGV